MTPFLNEEALNVFLVDAIRHYEETAPAVAAYLDHLYFRLREGDGDLRLSEIQFAERLRPNNAWIHPDFATNAVHHHMHRLGMRFKEAKAPRIVSGKIIVPPAHLVKLFGVPERVTMPSKVGEELTYVAHGKTFAIFRRDKDTWSLACPDHSLVAIIGNADVIADAIGHTLRTGALPEWTQPKR